MSTLKDLKKEVKVEKSLSGLKRDLEDASPFISWKPVLTADGKEIRGEYEPLIGKLVNYERVTQTFKDKATGQDKTTLRYKFTLVIDGRERILSTGQRCAAAIAEATEELDVMLKIMRMGDGFDTEYKVEVLND